MTRLTLEERTKENQSPYERLFHQERADDGAPRLGGPAKSSPADLGRGRSVLERLG